MALKQKDAPAPVPAQIVTEAATSRGVVALSLSPAEGLSYRMHQTGALAERLTMLEAVADEDVLVRAGALLQGDGARELAGEVVDRVNSLRRARADEAGVDVEADEAPGLLWSGERELLTPLSPTEHALARMAAVEAVQRMLDAETAEKVRATAAKALVDELRTLHKAAQRVAYSGEDYRTQTVEMVVEGGRVVTRRLDTGDILDEREATAAEIEKVSQVKLWGGR